MGRPARVTDHLFDRLRAHCASLQLEYGKRAGRLMPRDDVHSIDLVSWAAQVAKRFDLAPAVHQSRLQYSFGHETGLVPCRLPTTGAERALDQAIEQELG